MPEDSKPCQLIQTRFYKTSFGELVIGSFKGSLCDWSCRKLRNAVDNRIERLLKITFSHRESTRNAPTTPCATTVKILLTSILLMAPIHLWSQTIIQIRGTNTDKQNISKNSNTKQLQEESTINQLAIILRDSEITIPLTEGGTAKLHNGYASHTNEEGFSTTLQLVNLYVTWTLGDRTDLLALAEVRPGGSGVFNFLILLDASGPTLTSKSEKLLGDRIELYKLNIEETRSNNHDYTVLVDMLDRAENDPQVASPGIRKLVRFHVKNQKLL